MPDFLFIALLVFSFLGLLLSFLFHIKSEKSKWAILFLLISGISLRIIMAQLDPFLHNWDERYHALVAKNLITSPFKPMLIVEPLLEYRLTDWCCNHIWLHKQPFFLWQIAASLKLFGVNEFAIRIPSILMSSISIVLIFKIAQLWLNDYRISLLAACLFCFSNFNLELVSGRYSLDHNDLAFGFYITLSLWAFLNFNKKPNVFWAILIGICSGLSILIKWLPGLIVYLTWISFLVMQKLGKRIEIKKEFFYLLLSITVCLVIFLPWQFYIVNNFPEESAVGFQHFLDHFWTALGNQGGDFLYHFRQFDRLYSIYLLPFVLIGLFQIFRRKETLSLSISFVISMFAFYLFFSIAQTKLPGYTYPMHSIIFILMAIGITALFRKIEILKFINKSIFMISGYLIIIVPILKPFEIIDYRSIENAIRENKIFNSNIYKNLEAELYNDGVMFNCPEYSHVELMFYKDIKAYHYFPQKDELEHLKTSGQRIYAFKEHKHYELPDYFKSDSSVIFIEGAFR